MKESAPRWQALRAEAEQAKAAGVAVSVGAEDLLRLLDAHESALALADAVTSLRAAETGREEPKRPERSSGVTAGELRNRWRRTFEERGLRTDAALAAFRRHAL